jgi:hypothetical protein
LEKRKLAKEIAGLAARMSWIVLSRVIAFTAFGVILNVVSCAIDFRALLSYVHFSEAGMPGARAGGIGALLVLVVMLIFLFARRALGALPTRPA